MKPKPLHIKNYGTIPHVRGSRIDRGENYITPRIIHIGQPFPVKKALQFIESNKIGSGHGAIDFVEGVVYRVEREGQVDFLAKYIHPKKEVGRYLSGDPVWNISPEYMEDILRVPTWHRSGR